MPLKSWGQLPVNLIDLWKAKKCDMVFTTQRMAQKEVSKCSEFVVTQVLPQKKSSSSFFSFFTGDNGDTGDAGYKPVNEMIPKNTNLEDESQSFPLIAIMAASTTRNIKNPTINNLAISNYLLPSLMRTLDCGFRYVFVLGYDMGDPFYDSEEVKLFFIDEISRYVIIIFRI